MILKEILRLTLIFGAGAVFFSACASLPEPVSNGRQGFLDQGPSVRTARRENTRRGVTPSRKTKRKILENAVVHSSSNNKSNSNSNTQGDGPGAVAVESAVSQVSPSGYQWPLESVEVTSFFGKRGRHAHEGIDLRAPNGTPVFAAKEGLVLYADTAIRGYGKLVVIRHEGKAATIYAHNSKLLVKRGQRIKQGQQIAFSGSTGHVTGPHLHFEIRHGLNAQNPMKYLPRLGHHKKQLAQNKISRHRNRRDLRVAAIK